jgi:hypothetical protein
MSRPFLILLALALPTAGFGCSFARKMTARPERPANSVLVGELPPEERPDHRASSPPRAEDVADADRERVVDQAGHDRPTADRSRTPSHADELADEPIEPRPRNGWASLLNPFQPAKAIPVPRNDLPEPAGPPPARERPHDPAAAEDVDLFDGF